jgi:UDP-N-acetylmuramate dehydrogenase
VAPAAKEDLIILLQAARAEGIPVFILGGGANLVFSDRGLRGIVVDTRLLDRITIAGSRIAAEAGTRVDRLCEACRDAGLPGGKALAGLETFYGMPGSLGGAVFMNARCYEVEMADRLSWVESVLPDGGGLERESLDHGQWAYKLSPYQPGGARAGRVILAAGFELEAGETEAVARVMAEKRADREAKGHYRLPSAGSVFKNDRSLGRPTGKILDELGFRGRRVGGAMVSEWHANIFVNTGGATAADLRALVDLARDEARKALGVELEAEVLFVGD